MGVVVIFTDLPPENKNGIGKSNGRSEGFY